jgi:hypothetical protein
MLIDLTGKKFGRLKVLKRGRHDSKHLWWVCRCSCPLKTTKEVRGDALRGGITQGCGCIQREVCSARAHHYELGKKFGRLTVIEESGTRKKRGPIYLCRCACGNKIKVQGRHLRSGESRSCGCLYRDTRRTANRRHGKSPCGRKIPVYSAYHRQRSLCLNPKTKHFNCYGGRGILFCFDSFPEFYAAVGDKPGPLFWLMRKDPDKHFERDNLHWVEKGLRKRVRK